MNLMRNFSKPISKSDSTTTREDHAPSTVVFYLRVTAMVQDPRAGNRQVKARSFKYAPPPTLRNGK